MCLNIILQFHNINECSLDYLNDRRYKLCVYYFFIIHVHVGYLYIHHLNKYLVIFNSNNIFRTLRQNPNDKRADLSEEIPLYTSSKGLCDTSVYSEIPENNKNSQVCVYA